jgi:hypothetical protein
MPYWYSAQAWCFEANRALCTITMGASARPLWTAKAAIPCTGARGVRPRIMSAAFSAIIIVVA